MTETCGALSAGGTYICTKRANHLGVHRDGTATWNQYYKTNETIRCDAISYDGKQCTLAAGHDSPHRTGARKFVRDGALTTPAEQPKEPMQITITLPDDATVGDLTTASGAIFKAATEFVDWDKLREEEPGGVSPAGVMLLDIANQLGRESE